jgi:SPP1 family holin
MDKASLTRMIAMLIALLNAVLNILGYETIPVEFGEELSAVILVLVGLYAGWKNNYLSKKGKAQKEALEEKGLK